MRVTVGNEKTGIGWTDKDTTKSGFRGRSRYIVTETWRLKGEKQQKRHKKRPMKTGVQVNIEKTQVMKVTNHHHQQQPAPITTNRINLKEVVSFT